MRSDRNKEKSKCRSQPKSFYRSSLPFNMQNGVSVQVYKPLYICDYDMTSTSSTVKNIEKSESYNNYAA